MITIVMTIRDLMGCVGMGSRHGILRGEWAVMQARKTFAEYMDRMHALERQDSDLWIAIGNVTADGGVVT